MKKLEDAQALAEQLGLKIEPAGMRHAYINACAEIPPPKFVVRHSKPAYDLYHCRTVEQLMDYLEDRRKLIEEIDSGKHNLNLGEQQ